MNHCSSLPATCTPPPLPASGPRTLLKSTRPLSAFPPAHSQPHLIWHDALHPSPGHKVAIVALVRRASRPLAETASSLAAVDRPPAFQLPATCIQMRVPVVVPLGPLAHPVSAYPVHIPQLRSHPHSTVQDQMYPSYAHQLLVSHCTLAPQSKSPLHTLGCTSPSTSPRHSCLRLCARAHHVRPIPHRHPSHRHLLIALARHALPALPDSPAHTPLPRFAPGSCAHITTTKTGNVWGDGS